MAFRDDAGGTALRLAEAQPHADHEVARLARHHAVVGRRRSWVLFGKLCAIGTLPLVASAIGVLFTFRLFGASRPGGDFFMAVFIVLSLALLLPALAVWLGVGQGRSQTAP